jgi:Domain of unknown function (DUF4326)
MRPVRIQRRRAQGYDMQAESRKANGLDCIAVTRPGKWGNPYDVKKFGRPLALAVFRNTVLGMWNPNLLDGQPKSVVTAMQAAHNAWLKRLGGHPRELIRSELRGHNLSCFCSLSDDCHADVYLEILNKTVAAP